MAGSRTRAAVCAPPAQAWTHLPWSLTLAGFCLFRLSPNPRHPWELSPQTSRVPAAVQATVCLDPKDTWTTLSGSFAPSFGLRERTSCGSATDLKTLDLSGSLPSGPSCPWPSWPLRSFPHVNTRPPSTMQAVCVPPAAALSTGPCLSRASTLFMGPSSCSMPWPSWPFLPLPHVHRPPQAPTAAV